MIPCVNFSAGTGALPGGHKCTNFSSCSYSFGHISSNNKKQEHPLCKKQEHFVNLPECTLCKTCHFDVKTTVRLWTYQAVAQYPCRIALGVSLGTRYFGLHGSHAQKAVHAHIYARITDSTAGRIVANLVWIFLIFSINNHTLRERTCDVLKMAELRRSIYHRWRRACFWTRDASPHWQWAWELLCD